MKPKWPWEHVIHVTQPERRRFKSINSHKWRKDHSDASVGLRFAPRAAITDFLSVAPVPVQHTHRSHINHHHHHHHQWESSVKSVFCDLSVSADLHSLVVVPGVQQLLRELEGQTLLTDPFHTEHAAQTGRTPVQTALAAHRRRHARVTLPKTHDTFTDMTDHTTLTHHTRTE